ncbi:UrcA family protein [Novosphingobium sp. FKTRR1]|uniref:UrcA family protein n=1 Tax=Novosphingobium sp. FKTRR1 TaxID=2879118 RepID=UPI001CF0C24B|nr:UrcA family protein [Novosphingobium sp. FKTRR1]
MNRKSIFTASLVAALIAPIALVAPAAHAAEPATGVEVASIEVRYGDLNLASAQGQDQLDARLRQAARKVCGASFGPMPLSEELNARKCYTRALGTAQQTLASAQYRKVLSRR